MVASSNLLRYISNMTEARINFLQGKSIAKAQEDINKEMQEQEDVDKDLEA